MRAHQVVREQFSFDFDEPAAPNLDANGAKISPVTLVCADVLAWAETYTGPKFHALLTDAPYSLGDGTKGFMNARWDTSIAFKPDTWKALAQHLLPGAFGLVFASARGFHRLAVALEDAGLILHPAIFLYAFGSGFPKSTRILDERFTGHRYGLQAIKPAVEPLLLWQKPYLNGARSSITQTGAGALNIDGGRIGITSDDPNIRDHASSRSAPHYSGHVYNGGAPGGYDRRSPTLQHPAGRWPANFCLQHLSIPVLRLKGHLPCDTLEAIRRYYDGYTGVSAMRGRKGYDAVQGECGAKVLQQEMQERIIPNEPNTKASRADVSAMQQDLSCSNGMGKGRTPEILQSNMPGPISQDTDRREESTLGQDTQQRVTGQDFTDTGGAWTHIAHDGSEPSTVEGRCQLSQRLSHCADQHAYRRTATNGSIDETHREIYFGTSPCSSDEIGSSIDQDGDCPSPQWQEGRQQPGEPRTCQSRQTFTDAPEDRAGIISTPLGCSQTAQGEWSLEVLARDVPDGWLEYFELTGEDLGCVRVGVRQVRGAGWRDADQRVTADGWRWAGDGRSEHPQHHTDATGHETVDAWECAPGCPVFLLDQQAGERPSGGARHGPNPHVNTLQRAYEGGWEHAGERCESHSSGSASRFFFTASWSLDVAERLAQADPVFYCAKASRRERDAGLEGMPLMVGFNKNTSEWKADVRHPDGGYVNHLSQVHNPHPTIKPLTLTQWLATLLLPPDAYAPRRLLNPFGGVASEALGAMRAGWDEIVMIEQDQQYVDISRARINFWSSSRHTPMVGG